MASLRVPSDRSKPTSRTAKSRVMSTMSPALSSYESAEREVTFRVTFSKKEVDGKPTIMGQIKRSSCDMYGPNGTIKKQPLEQVFTDPSKLAQAIQDECASIKTSLEKA